MGIARNFSQDIGASLRRVGLAFAFDLTTPPERLSGAFDYVASKMPVPEGPDPEAEFPCKVGRGGLADVACFSEGTLIRTMYGDIPVEQMAEYDRVVTRDHGVQVLRWIGARRCAAGGQDAPVLIRAGQFGPHGDVLIPRQTKLLLRAGAGTEPAVRADALVTAGELAEAGLAEVQRPVREVTVYHLLFDRSEVLWANGLEVLSDVQRSLPEVQQHMTAAFPELERRRELRRLVTPVRLSD